MPVDQCLRESWQRSAVPDEVGKNRTVAGHPDAEARPQLKAVADKLVNEPETEREVPQP